MPKTKTRKQSTNNWINVWGAWAEQKGHDKSNEGYEPVALNKILEDFYATLRKKNGEDYEPDSLRIMVTAMDRYLADKGYKYSIIRGREFQSSKQVFEGKARMLRQQGKGKRPNKLEVSNCCSILLTSNHVIFLVQFEINKHL